VPTRREADGVAAETGERPGASARRSAGVRLSELMAARSFSTDLGLGQPMEHVLRSCLIALRLADRLDLDERQRAETYWVTLLARRPSADGHRPLPPAPHRLGAVGAAARPDERRLGARPGAGRGVRDPAGHDAWVVGDDPCRLLDWGGKVRGYARPAGQTAGGAQ
jgi:hypothetical protein